jgi:hypothetical protein
MTVLKLLLPTSFLLSATAGAAADGVNTALNTQTPSARSRTTRQQREVKLERQADGRGCHAFFPILMWIGVIFHIASVVTFHYTPSQQQPHAFCALSAEDFFCFAAQPEIAPINQLFYGNELMPRGNHAPFYRFFALKLCVLGSHELCQWTLQRALISIAGRFALSIYAPLRVLPAIK